MLSWRYIAGFFDGEGCITAPNACVVIRMSQKPPEVLERIGEFLNTVPRKPPSKSSWSLTIQGRDDVLDFIDGVLPFSIVKRSQLEVAKKIALLQPERYSPGSTKKSATKTEREELAKELGRLKHG